MVRNQCDQTRITIDHRIGSSRSGLGQERNRTYLPNIDQNTPLKRTDGATPFGRDFEIRVTIAIFHSRTLFTFIWTFFYWNRFFAFGSFEFKTVVNFALFRIWICRRHSFLFLRFNGFPGGPSTWYPNQSKFCPDPTVEEENRTRDANLLDNYCVPNFTMTTSTLIIMQISTSLYSLERAVESLLSMRANFSLENPGRPR